MANPSGHPDEQLESVLGATPHEFESRILRLDQRPGLLLAVRAFVVGGVGQSCSVSRVAALDAVENDAEELVITRAGHEPLVVVSLAEYASLRETDYLLRSPANAEHLRRSLQEYQQGRAQARELIDPEDLSEQTA